MAIRGDTIDGKLILYSDLCSYCGHKYGMHSNGIKGECCKTNCDCPHWNSLFYNRPLPPTAEEMYEYLQSKP